jgi:hypothetical protein
MTEHTPMDWRWQGRPVRLVDGATVSLADTPTNQEVYPQPGSQAPGLGFPQARIVALICLACGGVLNAAMGPCLGKGSDEQSLLRAQLDTLQRDDILLGDAFYATYFLFCELKARGVDGVFEQHGARRRSTDFRRGQTLGSRDHLIELQKPKTKPAWMSPTEFEQAPDTLVVRELHVGGKLLVTTLLCPKQTPKLALKKLYRDRWHVELDLRNIKTTLGMETLSCQTPLMVLKEIWVYLLAYNLIRLLMAQAACLVDCLPRQLSFKHTLQLWLAWGHSQVGNRPGRIEPRAIKRRPKPFPLLTKPRNVAREEVRKNGHPKKLK